MNRNVAGPIRLEKDHSVLSSGHTRHIYEGVL